MGWSSPGRGPPPPALSFPVHAESVATNTRSAATSVAARCTRPDPSMPLPPLSVRTCLAQRPGRDLLLRVDERDRRRPANERTVLGLHVELRAHLGELDRDPYVADVALQPRRPDGVGDPSYLTAIVE